MLRVRMVHHTPHTFYWLLLLRLWYIVLVHKFFLLPVNWWDWTFKCILQSQLWSLTSILNAHCGNLSSFVQINTEAVNQRMSETCLARKGNWMLGLDGEFDFAGSGRDSVRELLTHRTRHHRILAPRYERWKFNSTLIWPQAEVNVRQRIELAPTRTSPVCLHKASKVRRIKLRNSWFDCARRWGVHPAAAAGGAGGERWLDEVSALGRGVPPQGEALPDTSGHFTFSVAVTSELPRWWHPDWLLRESL